MCDIARNHVIPTAINYQNTLIKNVTGLKEIFGEKEYKKYAKNEILDTIIMSLHYLKKTPALFFVFSRKECIYLAKNVCTNVIDHNIRAKIVETFNKYMHPYKNVYEQLAQYHEIYELIQRGIE